MTDPADMNYPVVWPSSVRFTKQPCYWTKDDAMNLVVWLGMCGEKNDKTYVNRDIAASAAALLAKLSASLE